MQSKRVPQKDLALAVCTTCIGGERKQHHESYCTYHELDWDARIRALRNPTYTMTPEKSALSLEPCLSVQDYL